MQFTRVGRKEHQTLRFIFLPSVALAGLLWVVGCGDDPAAPPAPVATTVVVTPETPELTALGATVQLSAEVLDANGQAIAGAVVTWSSSNDSIATVGAAGLVTAVSNGRTRVTASAGTVSGGTDVTVEQLVTATEITAARDTLFALGDTLRLSALALDANGHTVPGALFSWSSADTIVATVDSGGLVTAVSNGRTRVTASVGTVSGGTDVTVEQLVTATEIAAARDTLFALGDTVRLFATARDANGHGVPDVQFTWASEDSAVVTVDGSGLVTAQGSGSASVTAAAGDILASRVLTVVQRTSQVRVSPTADTLVALGDTLRLSALALDANGHTVPGALFSWSSADTMVATVDSGGLVTAVSNGLAEVTAAFNETSGSAAVTVMQVATEMSVSSLADTIRAGESVQLSAMPTDANGHFVADAELAWSSTDESIATVDDQGLVTGLSSGSVGITARESTAGLSGTVSLVVYEPSDVLGALYDALGGDGWTNSNNWGTDAPLNTWYGVSTDDEGRVTGIDLSNNNLAGSIPPAIARLENLALLDLSSNGLYAEPAGNRGAVAAAFTETEVCGFPTGAGGGLTGPLPPELGALSKLRVLNLAYNSLIDSIPGALGNLSSLEILDLGYNTLSGSIPAELGQLRALRILNLCFNRRADRQGRFTDGLNGNLPNALGDLEKLEILNLRSNSLSGPIPPELGGLSSLRTLDLSNNSRFEFDASTGVTERVGGLSGSIPPHLGSLEHLVSLNLNGNALSGSIPPELGGLRSLTTLDLSHNAYAATGKPEGGLTGEIPTELANLANLEFLTLDSNRLTGPIPPELGDLVNLRDLHLSYNSLSGSIPPELGGLRSLRTLRLSSNGVYDDATDTYTGGLSGSIPSQLGDLQQLRTLGLDYNNLSGSIPPQLGNLKALRTLALSGNNLSGQLPPALARMESLSSLGIDNNPLLTGAIPSTFVALRLRQFSWYNTDLCIPAGAAFRAWLNSIRFEHGTGVQCAVATDSLRLDFNSPAEVADWQRAASTDIAVGDGILRVGTNQAGGFGIIWKEDFLESAVTDWEARGQSVRAPDAQQPPTAPEPAPILRRSAS